MERGTPPKRVPKKGAGHQDKFSLIRKRGRRANTEVKTLNQDFLKKQSPEPKDDCIYVCIFSNVCTLILWDLWMGFFLGPSMNTKIHRCAKTYAHLLACFIESLDYF